MYEIIHRERDTELLWPYQQWLTARGCKHYRFQTRLFFAAQSEQIATLEADFERTFPTSLEPEVAIVPAQWLFAAIDLTKRHPLAHQQLLIALVEELSVEVFACNMAVAFAAEWKAIKQPNRHP
jgi:hypothetical protein